MYIFICKVSICKHVRMSRAVCNTKRLHTHSRAQNVEISSFSPAYFGV